MKRFITATFLAFLLAKATSFIDKSADTTTSLGKTLTQVSDFLINIGLDNFKAFNLIHLGKGFNGADHIINYLITYIPIFMLIMFLAKPITNIFYNLLFKLFTRKDNEMSDYYKLQLRKNSKTKTVLNYIKRIFLVLVFMLALIQLALFAYTFHIHFLIIPLLLIFIVNKKYVLNTFRN
ncbi:hypothetical protein [Aliarcobacter butzleri]|uniref:hypothetical protein n=1 Tax=Aliarcobacter butzleri TaxID=28197 RepID=UPI0021B44172|nr:hypothetical protein [Aliarcobacter butzleri]MCT7596120.1 hypothetical protein [Aliarcobacter butzleri]